MIAKELQKREVMFLNDVLVTVAVLVSLYSLLTYRLANEWRGVRTSVFLCSVQNEYKTNDVTTNATVK